MGDLIALHNGGPVPELTPRQWDLLHLIAGGRTNRQIASQLALSKVTVRTHLENIYSRLLVSNRTLPELAPSWTGLPENSRVLAARQLETEAPSSSSISDF